MRWGLYAIAGLIILSTLTTICMTGKPRKPITPVVAAVVVACNAAIATVLILAAMRL